jgi:hypothetical protein
MLLFGNSRRPRARSITVAFLEMLKKRTQKADRTAGRWCNGRPEVVRLYRNLAGAIDPRRARAFPSGDLQGYCHHREGVLAENSPIRLPPTRRRAEACWPEIRAISAGSPRPINWRPAEQAGGATLPEQRPTTSFLRIRAAQCALRARRLTLIRLSDMMIG